jgi:hypothetical protein
VAPKPNESESRSLPPLEAELDEIMVLGNNTLWVQLSLDDDTDLTLEFGADSPVAQELLDLVGRAANERFARLAQRGIELTGFTAPVGEDTEEDTES